MKTKKHNFNALETLHQSNFINLETLDVSLILKWKHQLANLKISKIAYYSYSNGIYERRNNH